MADAPLAGTANEESEFPSAFSIERVSGVILD